MYKPKCRTAPIKRKGTILMTKTQAEHELHLAKRREYYARNRERIRERDNANAKKKRHENPAKYKEYLARYKATHPKKVDVGATLWNNPDRDFIISLFV